MKLNVNLRPNRVTSTSRDGVMRIISAGCITSFGSLGNYLSPMYSTSQKFVRVYNLEKHRRRVRRYQVPGKKTMQSRVVKTAGWVGQYYDIPAELLKMAGLEVHQKSRFFQFRPARFG